MFMSSRARRMQRRHARRRHAEKLTLVSMVDILTALVTFLLANSVAVQPLPLPDNMVLPQSSAKQIPKVKLTVTITPERILVGKTAVASVAALSRNDGDTIPALTQALQQQAAAVGMDVPSAADTDTETARTAGSKPAAKPHAEVTIAADKRIPYRLIKKVMLSCTKANMQAISLVVLQHQEQG